MRRLFSIALATGLVASVAAAQNPAPATAPKTPTPAATKPATPATKSTEFSSAYKEALRKEVERKKRAKVRATAPPRSTLTPQQEGMLIQKMIGGEAKYRENLSREQAERRADTRIRNLMKRP